MLQTVYLCPGPIPNDTPPFSTSNAAKYSLGREAKWEHSGGPALTAPPLVSSTATKSPRKSPRIPTLMLQQEVYFGDIPKGNDGT